MLSSSVNCCVMILAVCSTMQYSLSLCCLRYREAGFPAILRLALRSVLAGGLPRHTGYCSSYQSMHTFFTSSYSCCSSNKPSSHQFSMLFSLWTHLCPMLPLPVSPWSDSQMKPVSARFHLNRKVLFWKTHLPDTPLPAPSLSPSPCSALENFSAYYSFG